MKIVKFQLRVAAISLALPFLVLTNNAFASDEAASTDTGKAVAIQDSITETKDNPTATDTLSGDYLKGYFSDTGRMIASPLHWDKKDWLKAGIVAGVTGGFYLLDARIRDFAQNHHNGVANKMATVGNDLGNPLYTLPPVAAFYLYGTLADDSKARKTSMLAVESLAISSLFTEAIKVTAHRDRPNSGASPNTWEGPHFGSKNLSFNSGHTASAFSIATVFAEQYKDSPYVPPIAYGLATLTGLSRIYSNEHWASDIVFGAAIGYFVGKTVVKYHNDGLFKKVSITPIFSDDFKGMSVSYKF